MKIFTWAKRLFLTLAFLALIATNVLTLILMLFRRSHLDDKDEYLTKLLRYSSLLAIRPVLGVYQTWLARTDS
jgi:hypothetical protein